MSQSMAVVKLELDALILNDVLYDWLMISSFFSIAFAKIIAGVCFNALGNRNRFWGAGIE